MDRKTVLQTLLNIFTVLLRWYTNHTNLRFYSGSVILWCCHILSRLWLKEAYFLPFYIFYQLDNFVLPVVPFKTGKDNKPILEDKFETGKMISYTATYLCIISTDRITLFAV